MAIVYTKQVIWVQQQKVSHLLWELESQIRSQPENIANSPILSADPPINPS